MRKKSSFYYFYLGLVAFLSISIISGLIVLRLFLKAYESGQPKSVVQNIFNEYIKTGEIYNYRQDYNFKLSKYETEGNLKKLLDGISLDGDVEINYSSQVPKGSDICFLIKSNGENVISIALSKNKEKGKFGIRGYKTDEIKFLGDVYRSVKLTFPSNASVSVNGKKLSEDDINVLPLPEIKDVDFGKDVISSCYCELSNLINGDPEITAESDSFDIVKTEEGYSVNQKFEQKFETEILDFALKGAQIYAAHMQDDKSLSELSKYVDSTSDFYKNVRNTIVSFSWDHDGYDFENVKCSSLQKHSDEIYSCRVSFTHVLKLGARRYRDQFNKQIYLRVNGNLMKIVDMQSIE